MTKGVLHWQVVSTDPEAATKFYGALFGWKATNANALGYRELSAGSGIGGGIWPAPPGAQSFVQLFVGVEDVEQAVQEATRLGGKVVVPPAVLPDGDQIAIIADPTGVPFGLMRAAPVESHR